MHFQEYRRGVPVAPLAASATPTRPAPKIAFKPDPTIFTSIEMQYDILASRLRELSFLNAGLRHHADRRARRRPERDLPVQGRHREFVEHLNKTKEPVNDKVISIIAEHQRRRRRCAQSGSSSRLQWNATYSEQIFCYTNNVHNKDGGTHLTGLARRAHQGLQQTTAPRRICSRT